MVQIGSGKGSRCSRSTFESLALVRRTSPRGDGSIRRRCVLCRVSPHVDPMTFLASRRSFRSCGRYWLFYAQGGLCGRRHAKGHHPHIVWLHTSKLWRRRRHVGHGRAPGASAGRKQDVHRPARPFNMARRDAHRQPHQGRHECAHAFFCLLLATVH